LVMLAQACHSISEVARTNCVELHQLVPNRLQPGISPHALRIPPRDGHPALRSTAGWWLQVRLGLCPAFAFVPV
jgi:hypothetical protein